MNDILKALERKEPVEIFYRGKIKGRIIPDIKRLTGSVKEHALFGLLKEEGESVEEKMTLLRGGRYHDI
jgi:hypothetical protein